MDPLVHISLLVHSSLFILTPQNYNLTDKFYCKHVWFTYWPLPFLGPGEATLLDHVREVTSHRQWLCSSR